MKNKEQEKIDWKQRALRAENKIQKLEKRIKFDNEVYIKNIQSISFKKIALQEIKSILDELKSIGEL